MTNLANALVFEVCYNYWAWACGYPSRHDYGTSYLRDGKRGKK